MKKICVYLATLHILSSTCIMGFGYQDTGDTNQITFDTIEATFDITD